MASTKRFLLGELFLLIFLSSVFSSPISIGSEKLSLSKQFEQMTTYWEKNGCVFPSKVAYGRRPDIAIIGLLASPQPRPKDFPLKACSTDDEGANSVRSALCIVLFDISERFCQHLSPLEKEYLNASSIDQLVTVHNSSEELCEDVKGRNVLPLLKNDPSICAQCGKEQALQPVCSQLFAAILKYLQALKKEGPRNPGKAGTSSQGSSAQEGGSPAAQKGGSPAAQEGGSPAAQEEGSPTAQGDAPAGAGGSPTTGGGSPAAQKGGSPAAQEGGSPAAQEEGSPTAQGDAPAGAGGSPTTGGGSLTAPENITAEGSSPASQGGSPAAQGVSPAAQGGSPAAQGGGGSPTTGGGGSPATGGGNPATGGGGSLATQGGGSLATQGGGSLAALENITTKGGNPATQGGGNPASGGGDSLAIQGGGSLETQGGSLATQGGSLATQGGGSLATQGGGSPATQGGGSLATQGGGSPATQGGGSLATQGGGSPATQGGGSPATQGGGSPATQGGGSLATQGGGSPATQGGGNPATQGGGSLATQGGGSLATQGGGSLATQGGGGNGKPTIKNAGGFTVSKSSTSGVAVGEPSSKTQGPQNLLGEKLHHEDMNIRVIGSSRGPPITKSTSSSVRSNERFNTDSHELDENWDPRNPELNEHRQPDPQEQPPNVPEQKNPDQLPGAGLPADVEASNNVMHYNYKDEPAPSGHFMAYFVTAVVLCVAGYVIYHNKQKIFAIALEGRRDGQRRRPKSGGDGGSSTKYSKLQSSMEEVVPSLEKSTTSKNYIY